MVFLFGPLVYHCLQAHPSPKACQSNKFAKTGRDVSIHQFGEDMRQQKRTLIIVLLHQFNVGIYTSPCSTRCDIVYEDSFLKTLLLKGRNDGRSNEAQQCACRTTLT